MVRYLRYRYAIGYDTHPWKHPPPRADDESLAARLARFGSSGYIKVGASADEPGSTRRMDLTVEDALTVRDADAVRDFREVLRVAAKDPQLAAQIALNLSPDPPKAATR